jgi:hypothetical protein
MSNVATFCGSIALPVPIPLGGTGHATCPAAFDAISPADKAGDLIYFDGTHNVRLEAGPPGWTLQMNQAGTAPEWVKV